MNTSTRSPDPKADYDRLKSILSPHIHAVDLPYRLASTWQDWDCELGIWEHAKRLQAWAVFQPPWFNLDFAFLTGEDDPGLIEEVIVWGIAQMKSYAQRIQDDFYGSVEFFADDPLASYLLPILDQLGFTPFDWNILRFEIDLAKEIPQPHPPEGFTIRPLRGETEIDAYVDLHRATFGSSQMTAAWRKRTLLQPAYQPYFDLLVVNPRGEAVGFCICWMDGERGQIEPLGVHPAYQGQGLGKALELTALQRLQEQGARYGLVDHASYNQAAIALSLQTGFQQSHNALRYYLDIVPD